MPAHIDTGLRGLDLKERDRAVEIAKQKVIGPEIDPDSFKVRTLSKYHPALLTFVFIVLTFVFIASFSVSAFHLDASGQDAFCSGANIEWKCRIAGYSAIIRAELGQIIFFLALAVLPYQKKTHQLLYAGVIITTVIALVGNAHIMRPWNNIQINSILETFTPPILSMLLGYVLKELILTLLARRAERSAAVEKAIYDRQVRMDNPELATNWYRVLTLTLRDALRKVNRRRAAFKTAGAAEWQYLIKMEMQSMIFEVRPDQETALELRAGKPSLEEAVMMQLQPAPAPAIEAPIEATPAPNGEAVWLNNTGKWSVRSPDTGKNLGNAFETKKAAEQKLRRYTYHRNRRLRIREEERNG